MKLRLRAIGAVVATAAVLGVFLAWSRLEPGALQSWWRSSPERIILIVIDTLRLDHISAYGSEVPTPNIDALAARGQRFDNVIASFHQTSMSMAALFTGRTPSIESGQLRQPLPWNGRTWCGMRRFLRAPDSDTCIPPSVPTLAQALRNAGYWTAGVVTNALIFRPLGYERGFDRWVQVSDEKRARIAALFQGDYRRRSAAEANRAVARLLETRPTDRFFLYVHYMDTHDYLLAQRSYAESVSLADQGVGELLKILREQRLLDGAVIVLLSDHGERLHEPHLSDGLPAHAGNPSFEEVLRIPLIVAPAVLEQPSGMIRSDDVHRLIKRLARIGEEGDPDLESGELFLSEERYHVYRDGRWKSYRKRDEETFQLVDLEADPGETRDVASSHPEVVSRHLKRIDELERALAAADTPASHLTPEDERRLRSLGYLD
jgi:arylsulfatase A-like enzyme